MLRAATDDLVEDLRWHHDYLVEQLSARQLAALKRVAKGRSLPNLSPLEYRPLADYLRQTEDGHEINSEVLRQFLLRVPDRKAGTSGKVLSGVAKFARSAMQTAVRKAIEVAADKYLS